MRGLDARIHPSSKNCCEQEDGLPGQARQLRADSCTRSDMTTFQEARAFLLKHRTDYDKAVADFRWPDPIDFNWALDWFDAELARDAGSKGRTALWIVDSGSNRETKLSFET